MDCLGFVYACYWCAASPSREEFLDLFSVDDISCLPRVLTVYRPDDAHGHWEFRRMKYYKRLDVSCSSSDYEKFEDFCSAHSFDILSDGDYYYAFDSSCWDDFDGVKVEYR